MSRRGRLQSVAKILVLGLLLNNEYQLIEQDFSRLENPITGVEKGRKAWAVKIIDACFTCRLSSSTSSSTSFACSPESAIQLVFA